MAPRHDTSFPLGPSRLSAVSMLVLVCLPAPRVEADWPQFRGPATDGNISSAELPVEWSVKTGKNVAWSTELPGRGPSSPIVVGDRVFVTCSSGPNQDRLHVLALDAASGARLWERQFWATGRTMCHPVSANAAPTPASDGGRVFALFSSCDLVCLDLDGNLLWLRGLAVDFPKAGNDAGMASSPAVAGDVVVVQIECQGDSFAAGIDRATGTSRWVLKREPVPNWSSPIVHRVTLGQGAGQGGQAEVLVLLQSPSGVSAHAPATGEEIWHHKAGCDAIASSSSVGDLVLVPAAGVTALRPTAGPDDAVVWTANRIMPGAASPLVHQDRVYAINRAGVLVCGDLATGKILGRQLRLGGAFWATPVASGERLYAANDDGVVRVVSLGENLQIVASNDFGEKLQASPAIAGNALYFRSDRHLWKIAAQP